MYQKLVKFMVAALLLTIISPVLAQEVSIELEGSISTVAGLEG